MDHALVKKDGYLVPLMGVPATAMLEQCDCCHDQFPMDSLQLCGQQFLCAKCRSDATTDKVGTDNFTTGACQQA